MINARVETVPTSKLFQGVWRIARALAIADGWYEWIWRAQAQAALFHPVEICGAYVLRCHRPLLGSEAGMIDLHDRRPLVLPPDVAREWIDPELCADRAAEIGREAATPVDAFEWYPVSKAVGNVKNDGPDLLTLIDNPLL
ncbi:SOS response-associated peptidase family protein [Pseudomonas rhizoryzae]|uniref:SOS response-associated peptidase family protein n=1 Tax=Pseudomonas rhizoryzae TaxID=2571129 RepID=UPI0007371C6D|nr:SOS response-associated peptidase family protein [Pseudomonas rhizoryzae]